MAENFLIPVLDIKQGGLNDVPAKQAD